MARKIRIDSHGWHRWHRFFCLFPLIAQKGLKLTLISPIPQIRSSLTAHAVNIYGYRERTACVTLRASFQDDTYGFLSTSCFTLCLNCEEFFCHISDLISSSLLILSKFYDLPAGASSVRTYMSSLRDFSGTYNPWHPWYPCEI